jgi:hypothetical protein
LRGSATGSGRDADRGAPYEHAAGLVDTLLYELNGLSAEDAVVAFAASYVGDAYRGGSAEAVGAALTNMVQTCAQEGY